MGMDLQFKDCLPFNENKKNNIFENTTGHDFDLEDLLPEKDYGINFQLIDPQVFIIFDQISNNCSYISSNSKQILGYERRELVSEGIDFLHQIIYPEDLYVIRHDIIKDILDILPKISKNEQNNLRFSFNYRMKHKEGSYLHILQSGSSFNPLISGISMVRKATLTDISRFKGDHSIILKIEKVEDDYSQIIFSETYYPGPKDDLLTKKELEVLQWILKGFNSKTIAEKMFTSFHTIQTHRKHMLEKINAKNTADLILYALKNGMVNFRVQV
jgi:DNA-binding CsgD family transcriptional regulator/PAS domain-containing protein